MDSFAGCNGNIAPGGNQGHGIKIVRGSRVFQEEWSIFFNLLRKGDGFPWFHAAVELQTEVHVITNGFPHQAHTLHCIVYHAGIAVMVTQTARFIQKRRKMANGIVAGLFCFHYILYQFFRGGTADVIVSTDFVAAFSTQKLIDRNSEVFSGNVPQCNIDGTDRAHDSGTAEMEAAVHILPVMFNLQGILSNQVSFKGFYGLGTGI